MFSFLFCRNMQITPKLYKFPWECEKDSSSFLGSAKKCPIPYKEGDDFKGYMTVPRNKKFKLYINPPKAERKPGPMQKKVEKVEKELLVRMGWFLQEEN